MDWHLQHQSHTGKPRVFKPHGLITCNSAICHVGLQDKLYINGEGETFRSIRQVLRHLEEPLAQQEPPERSITAAVAQASSSAQPASQSRSPVSSAGGSEPPPNQKQLWPSLKAADAERRPIVGSPERLGHASSLPLGQPSLAAETKWMAEVGTAPAAGSEAASCGAPACLVLYHRGKQLPTRSKVRTHSVSEQPPDDLPSI